MSLTDVVATRAFDDATRDEQRVSVYVRYEQLGTTGAERPEVQLMDALRGQRRARVHVVGPSGSGKTSTILRVAADLAHVAPEQHHEVLVLRVGDRPEQLASGETVIKAVLDTIATQNHRFSSIDPTVFAAAAADERTAYPAQRDHALAVTAGIPAANVRYQAGIKQAYETEMFGTNPAQLRQNLQDVLAAITAAGYRPVLVVDDTEKFVAPGEHGQIDAASIEALYHHGIRALDEFDVDLVVAMHPRFEELERVGEVAGRVGMQRVAVPSLKADATDPPLAVILQRRLTRAGIDGTLEDVIDSDAVLGLQTLYHGGGRDLRAVLKVAHQAAADALRGGEDRVSGTGVLRILAGRA